MGGEAVVAVVLVRLRFLHHRASKKSHSVEQKTDVLRRPYVEQIKFKQKKIRRNG